MPQIDETEGADRVWTWMIRGLPNLISMIEMMEATAPVPSNNNLALMEQWHRRFGDVIAKVRARKEKRDPPGAG